MLDKIHTFHDDPDILGGQSVFVNTRVPVRVLFEYLEAGDNIETFLEDFPSVSHEQAVSALEIARQSTFNHARAA